MKTPLIRLSGARAAAASLSIIAAGCSALVQRSAKEPTGTLKVYSAEAWNHDDDGGPAYFHTEYKILRPQGGFVRSVQNSQPLGWHEPEAVTLAIGSYVVEAQASGRGTVNVPVKIEAGRMTVLHLEEPNQSARPAHHHR